MIKNLSIETDEDGLKKIFEKCGSITRCFIPKDKESNKRKGFAFMDFETETEASEAMKLNETDIDGKAIEIVYARPKQDYKSGGRFNDSYGGGGGGGGRDRGEYRERDSSGYGRDRERYRDRERDRESPPRDRNRYRERERSRERGRSGERERSRERGDGYKKRY